jgi:hypothetical protein
VLQRGDLDGQKTIALLIAEGVAWATPVSAVTVPTGTAILKLRQRISECLDAVRPNVTLAP